MAEVRVTRIAGSTAAADDDADADDAGPDEFTDEADFDDTDDYDDDDDDDDYDDDDEADADDDGRPAARPVIDADSPAAAAVVAVERILDTVGADVEVTLRAEHDELSGGPVIDINGPDSGLLIGRRGNTLQSLQFIVQSIVRQQFDQDIRVALDVEQYRRRREDSLREMADRVADRVAQTGRSITLEPMTPSDRRVIHLYLGERDGIRTESVGYGESRKVQIIPERG